MSYACTLLVYGMVVSAALHPQTVAAASKGGSSGASRSSTTTTTTSSSSASRITYGRSIGVSSRLRIVTAATLAIVYFNGYNYPAARFYYNDYYDDCALRNATAQQAGLNDSSINDVVIAQLPDLLAASNSAVDVNEFNQTLYNTTNGLIIDPAFCNYTYQNSGAHAARLSLLLAAALVAAAMWVVAAAAESGVGNAGRGWGGGGLEFR
ncbi:hypothetical protein PLESTB_000515100 [Pleodorina starrii]|uniref:Uncharacterized protein n=1 Tax=Pleodorina starrii TaxID=330485 RepID=A0A9W6F0P8_9CHLO|nr:hypothetical protein PLESTM_000378000 [Pleodorina starrii]GLC51555.1 hypothetical protein PLESTB_000515100 [Pleodorina starrii]GLC72321.1 hypothetical protein PLESTF_001235100 [Pleodorina starrii]